MDSIEQNRFEQLYQKHLTNLKLQGKRPSTIDLYSRPIRRLATFFDRCPDTLTADDLKTYFAALVQTHSWSTVKTDRNGIQFFWRHTLQRDWNFIEIIKPPTVKRLPGSGLNLLYRMDIDSKFNFIDQQANDNIVHSFKF